MRRQVHPWLGLLLLAGALAGCTEQARGAAAPAGGGGVLAGVGQQGRLRFSLQLQPASPVVGELFEVRTEVRDAATGEPVTGAQLVLDATMPEHGHGMVTRPEHAEVGAGRYLTRGMKLHMPGRWRFEVRAQHAQGEDTLQLGFHQPPRHVR